ncbi:MAG: hypothetical protein MAG794_01186 [Gammaproteobacteria bacterium]|nr:hypothetical protein [Gammaproteobacteria bacterium]
MDTRHLALIFFLIGVAPAARAAEILYARVDRVEDHYTVDFAVRLRGNSDRLRRIITDYPRFAMLSPTVTRSRIIDGRSGRDARIEITFRPCVFVFFCRTITKVSDAHIDEAAGRMVYVVVPNLSDFHEARETITLIDEPAGDHSRVRFVYFAVLKPSFFVPPLVGDWIIRHQIVTDLKKTSERVERILIREPDAEDR